MGSTPAGFLIESLLVPLDTVPAIEVRPVVLPDRFDNMSGLAIAAFATMDCCVLDGHRFNYRVLIMFFCVMNAIPAGS